MIYLDTSALIKLVLEEAESDALEAWLLDHDDTPTSSELARLEVLRGCLRADAGRLPQAAALMATVDLLPLTSGVLVEAADLPNPLLRTLDAIHLASALAVADDIAGFVAYDRRLADAAAAAGLTVAAPGA